jgi:hypothetical protein
LSRSKCKDIDPSHQPQADAANQSQRHLIFFLTGAPPNPRDYYDPEAAQIQSSHADTNPRSRRRRRPLPGDGRPRGISLPLQCIYTASYRVTDLWAVAVGYLVSYTHARSPSRPQQAGTGMASTALGSAAPARVGMATQVCADDSFPSCTLYSNLCSWRLLGS